MSDQEWREWEDSPIAQATAATQEANEMAPTIIVVGILPTGKLVKPEWAPDVSQVLSDRTINALTKLGINVIDEPEKYLF